MKLLRKILFPFNPLYYSVVFLRNKCFDFGIFKSKSYKTPIICVGNLSVGGTGKTPMIETLIQLLQKDYNVAVLSRGYGRQSKGFVLAKNTSIAKILGDEPYQIAQKFPNVTSKSALVSKALLRKGLLLYNANSTKKALDVFKRVAKEYPSTPESYQAIGSARSIYVDNGNVEDYAKWIGTLKYVAITDANLEKTTYESAEKQYLSNNTDKAISLFNGYISKFPNGTQIIKAHFYLAALYFKQDLKQNALPHYEYVVQQSANEFTEQALQKVCAIKLQNKEDAESDLKRLELEAKSPQNILFAQSNLMKIAFKNKAYSSRDAWSLFDQILITKPLLDDDYSSFKFYKASKFI